ncbi:PIN domain-containing protein [Candidatus Collierbacteria bacterium]|nr:PIN domain-containing protein [Candidatus Collierbacteria bacterium]
MNIVVDSSVIIDYIRAGVGCLPGLLESAKSGKIKLYVPTAVVLELWSGKSMNLVKNRQRVNLIFSAMEKIDLTGTIAKQAGALIRHGYVHSGFDSIIAASALELEARLATGNRRHFDSVKNLKFWSD